MRSGSLQLWRMTLRTAEIPRIDPNAVRQFGVGEAFVIAHGRAARVQVAPLGVTAEDGWQWFNCGGIAPIRLTSNEEEDAAFQRQFQARLAQAQAEQAQASHPTAQRLPAKVQPVTPTPDAAPEPT